MPDRYFLAAVTCLVGFAIYGRTIEERALKTLSTDQFALLYREFSGARIFRMVAFGLAAICFFALSSSENTWPFALPFLGLFFLIYIPISWIKISRHLSVLNLPASFTSLFRRSRFYSWLGILFYFIIVVVGGIHWG